MNSLCKYVHGIFHVLKNKYPCCTLYIAVHSRIFDAMYQTLLEVVFY